MYLMPLTGPERGRLQQFLSVPAHAECCGPVISGTRRPCRVQHPGETDGASPESPASLFPYLGDGQPAPA